jgi:hypothetical protein
MAVQQNVSKRGRSRRVIVKDAGSAHPPQDPPFGKTGAGKNKTLRKALRRTTIQLSGDTKSSLDRVKQEADAETYEDAIRFLLLERKKHRPSTFGVLAGAPVFVRDEEEDSHRIRD